MARAVLGIWLLLNLISLPFPMNWLPNGGQFISNLLFPINRFFANIIYPGIEQTYASDSIIYFMQSGFFLLFAICLVLFLKLFRRKLNYVNDALKILVSFLLFFFLFKYGLDKLFQHQFYQIEPNIAFTRLGHLSKDILFWSSMSSSSFYNTFMGTIEIITGILLVFERTRFLGALISIGIMSNILAINIGFDITVKLLSSLLMICSIYIVSFFPERIYTLIGISTSANDCSDGNNGIKLKYRTTIKGVILSLVLFEALVPFVQNDGAKKPGIYGSFTVTGDSDELFNKAQRIHFTSSGYLVEEDSDNNFRDSKLHYYESINEFRMNNKNIHYTIDCEGQVELSFIAKDALKKINLKPIKLNQLPVYLDNIHITLESMYEP